MNRRDSMLGLIALCGAPLSAIAQQTKRVPTIGVIVGAPVSVEYLKRGLRDLGYVEGRDIHIESRVGETNPARLSEVVAQLVAAKVDVIVTAAPVATIAAKRATQTIPIVFVVIGDPLASGLVPSLAHPDGNLTGTTRMLTEMSAKNLELLKEAVPAISRVAVLWNPVNSSHSPALKAVEATAHALSIELRPIEVRQATALDEALAGLGRERVQGVLLLADPIFSVGNNLKRITDFAASRHLPTATNWTELPDAGGLLGYATSISEEYKHAAGYVDKILKGAKPGDLPIEQPTKFELVINLRTAQAIGVKIPQSLLSRADRVIE